MTEKQDHQVLKPIPGEMSFESSHADMNGLQQLRSDILA